MPMSRIFRVAGQYPLPRLPCGRVTGRDDVTELVSEIAWPGTKVVQWGGLQILP